MSAIGGGAQHQERFYVAVTHGWRGDEPRQHRSDTKPRQHVPLTAMVLDRLNLHKPVWLIRSDAGGWPFATGGAAWNLGKRLNETAIALADEKAVELNAALAAGIAA